MAQPYVGEIRMFGGNFAPAGWAECSGQLLSIAENETLFQLIGTTYGGDGQTTFGLPDLRGRVPLHIGNGYVLGENGGAEEVTLTVNQMPSHLHTVRASGDTATSAAPVGLAGGTGFVDLYEDGPPDVSFAAQAVTNVGGSQPHENMMPFLGIRYIISLFGIFPSPT